MANYTSFYTESWNPDRSIMLILSMAPLMTTPIITLSNPKEQNKKWLATVISIWTTISFFITGKHYSTLTVDQSITLVLTDIKNIVNPQMVYLMSLAHSPTSLLAFIVSVIRRMEKFYRKDENAAMPRLIAFRRQRPPMTWNHGVPEQSPTWHAVSAYKIIKIMDLVGIVLYF